MARATALAAETELLPEPDKLDGFPSPRHTERLYGQTVAEQGFLDAFNSGRLHHAWIVTGPPGIGKATLAYRIARFLFAGDSERDMFGGSLDIDPATTAARLVANLAHPELLVLRRPYDFKTKKLKSEITVDEVRRLKGFLGMGAGEDWRVVIVDPVDELNANAANALLKSLEEPPKRTVFLLISSAPDRLLPTIRSRCRTLACTPLSDDALRKAVAQALNAADDAGAEAALPAGEEWQTLARLSEGSVRRFLLLHTAKGLDLHRKIAGAVALLPRIDWLPIHTLGDELASNAAEAKYELFFELLLGLLARLIRAAATGEGDPAEVKLATRLMPEDQLAAWAQLWETTVAEKASTEIYNLDRKSLILLTFQRLVQTSRGAAPA
ncbi:MAG: AAA family ATPase [Hyphomicrobium sp.]|jgi:DNA polymerase-3 subunit delta'|nr:AAA family ATPase [Hyphomicrobium sp.]PPD08234.1 MAG: AAA family ATPase [Hyphomicrobium sp.]